MSTVEGVTIDEQGRLVWQGRVYAAVDADAAAAAKALVNKEEEQKEAAAAEQQKKKEEAAKKEQAAKEEAAKKEAAAKKAAAAKEEAAKKPAAAAPAYQGDAMSLEGAWADLVSEKTATSWVLFGAPGRQLEFIAKGDGGAEELLPYFTDDMVLFAGLRVLAVDQQENVTSTRVKLVSMHFVGNQVKGMKKMGALQHKGTVERVMRGSCLTVQLDDPSLISLHSIAKELLAAGGAHKPSHYTFGPERVELQSLYE